jgi:hypothetical protein
MKAVLLYNLLKVTMKEVYMQLHHALETAAFPDKNLWQENCKHHGFAYLANKDGYSMHKTISFYQSPALYFCPYLDLSYVIETIFTLHN